ncbi:MAG TPA: FHA domain-containing protein [Polyangiaceae bacterium]|nr:FHA domain-containing protein [Polyangiaceae bacterium]
MWKLTIEDDEGKRTPLPLLRDEYTIGRGEENTVRLTERNISRKHASLRRNDTGWILADTASYNGSYVNGVRVAGEHLVAQGDVVQLGDYRLEFLDEEAAAKSNDPTQAATLPGAGGAGVKPDRLVVVVGPEPGQEFLIQSATINIGRAPELEICLPHTSVSRAHAEIHALGGGRYEIIDKASANGVRVNGSLLKRGLLEAGDAIELGEVKLKFVGAGQTYRLGNEAMRLSGPGEEKESSTLRPPPPSGPVFGTASSIDNFIGEQGGRSKFVKNLMIGAGVGLIAVIGLFAVRRIRVNATAAPSTGSALAPAPKAAEPVDPARVALDEAKALAAQGDLDLAHSRIALDVSKSAMLRDVAEVHEIEGRWADAVLARADQEQDMPTRRMLLSAVAQSATVDAGRRRAAADKLKEVEYLGTDIRELPQAHKTAPSPPNESVSARQPKPVLAADPWANPSADTRNGSASQGTDSSGKATDLAMQGREGEARARAQLEPRVWGGHATPDEIRMLRAICKHMGDRVCSDRASALLNGNK